MSKGPSQVGTKTTTAIDPLRQEQAKYLSGGWQSAQNLLQQAPQTPWPGSQYAEPYPQQLEGYGNLYNAGVNATPLNQAAYNPFFASTSGQYGIQNSPAYGGYQNIAGGYMPGQQLAQQNAGLMSSYAGMAGQTGQQGNAALGQVGQNAANTGQQYAGFLNQNAAGIPGMVQPYQSQLGYNAATAGANNPAMGLLGQQASGAYLNSNPYLDSMFGSASDAVTRGYQTATAPRTQSSYAAAGRYGSPSLSNAVSQNEQNLGKTLGNMAADIYGTNYGRERQLQNAATETLGSQYLSGLGQSTEAARAAGALGLSAAEAQQRGYNLAGQQALQGYQQQGQNLYQGGSLGLAGYNQAGDLLQGAGQLGLANTQAQQRALEGLQQGYYQGNAQALAGAGLAGDLIRNNITGANAQVQSGAGLQGIDQARLAAQMQQYQQQQSAPWTNLSNYMALIGQPTGQSSISQQPIYGSPMAQGVGLLGAGAQALGGKGGSSGSGSGAGYGANNYWQSGADVPYGAYGDYGGGGGGGGGAGDWLGGIGKTAMSFLPFLFGSDRRLKEDTKVIGNIGSLPLHSFRYRGDPVRRFGFMADEVERVDPGAVVTTNLGFKAVDYGRAAASALAREG